MNILVVETVRAKPTVERKPEMLQEGRVGSCVSRVSSVSLVVVLEVLAVPAGQYVTLCRTMCSEELSFYKALAPVNGLAAC